MTTINDISDLVQVLQDHPEWRHAIRGLVIGEELAQVPQQLTELERNLAAFIKSTDRRFEATEGNFQLLRESQEALRESQQETDRKLASFMEATERNFQLSRESQAALRESQQETDRKLASFMEATERNFQLSRESQQELDQRLASFMEATERNFQTTHENIQELDQRLADFVESTKQNFSLVYQHTDRVIGRMDNGFGLNYQYKVEKNIRSIAGQHFGLRRIRILRDYGSGYAPDLLDRIEQAVDDGIFTPDKLHQIWQIDLIFSGRRGDGATMNVAAELSINIAGSDVTRAAQRRSLLTRLLEHPVTAAVIGDNIDHSIREMAANYNVIVILYPDY